MSPRRSVLASVAAGCCLAASVVAGGYAASGAMPFSQWPGAIFSSGDAQVVALAPAQRGDAPVLTLPAATPERERSTRVIPLDDAPTGGREPAAAPKRTASRLPKAESRAPKTDDPEPDSEPTTAPAATPEPQPTPTASAASPAAEDGPAQPTQPAAPVTKRVKLADVSTTFAGASTSGSGQPELKVQMAVADDTQTAKTRTVALSLKLAPTDVQALMRNAASMSSAPIALETEVDVVDSTVVAVGQPACTDGTCLRVQMKFAQDTRTNPAEQPEVSLSDDGDAISNRVKVVVKIDPEDLGVQPAPAPAPSDPQPAPAPDAPAAPAPSVLSLPLPPVADADPSTPQAPAQPATDTTTVTLPDPDATTGTPDAPAVQVKAQLEVVDTPAAPADATTDPATAAAPAPAADTNAPSDDDCR